MGLFDFLKDKASSGDNLFPVSTNLPTGTKVKLWVRPDTSTIQVYQFGTIGGAGLLGKFDNPVIARHLSQNKGYDAIVENSKKIKILLIDETREESMQRSYMENTYPKVREEVMERINIRKLQIKIQTTSKTIPQTGDSLFPQFSNDIEDHIKDWRFILPFKDIKGDIIGIKDREPAKTRQMLRVHFVNKQKMDCKVNRTYNRYDYNDVEVSVTIQK